jgi:carboxylate-amine ligase
VTADGLTVGVEEEFYLVDDSGLLVHRAPEALRDLDRGGMTGIDLKPELLRCQVEAATEVCQSGHDVQRSLTDLRTHLAVAVARHGARLAATATVVHHQPHGWLIAPSARYYRIAQQYGPIVVSASTCGCHVHVGVADKALALRVVNHLRPWLPVLLALSANSPFLHGRDTAHASARHLIYRQWPCADPPPYLDSVDEYESISATLVDTGAALDRKMIYWYVRPSEQQPTVEIRVSDVLATVREATLLAVLVRALVAHALELIDSGVPAQRIPSESIKAGLWRAAKDGLGGRCPDPYTGRLRPVHAIIADLVRTLSPRLKESDELELVESTVDWLRRNGGGAHRQRHAFVRRGNLDDVLEEITFGGRARVAD